MEFGGEMWRNDSCRATKKKERRKERKKKRKHAQKEGEKKHLPPFSACFSRVFGRDVGSFTPREQALCGLPRSHSRNPRCRSGPSISRVASHGTSRRKKFNYNSAWWGWRVEREWKQGMEGKGRKRNRRTFEIVRSPPPPHIPTSRCRRVRRWKDNRGAPSSFEPA